MTCGIYMIKNKNTGQKYIGQSINIEKRWQQHCRKHDRLNSYIDNAIGKYGSDNFLLRVIEKLPNDVNMLNTREKYWIKFYNTYEDKNHYNLTPGGDFNPMCNPDTCKKISLLRMGDKNPNYNKSHKQSSKIKISQKRNKSGIFGVYFSKSKSYKRGFCFCYDVSINNKRKSFVSGNLSSLKQKVIQNGYDWIIVDKDKARDFLNKYGDM